MQLKGEAGLLIFLPLGGRYLAAMQLMQPSHRHQELAALPETPRLREPARGEPRDGQLRGEGARHCLENTVWNIQVKVSQR